MAYPLRGMEFGEIQQWGVLEIMVRGKENLAGTSLVLAVRYRDPAAAIDWLCAAFGFERHHVVSGDQGIIRDAHLTLGNGMIVVRPVGNSYLDEVMKQPDEIGGAETQSCYFVVDNTDAHYQKAKAAGASIVVDISDDGQGGRGYSCRDPEGHVWSFGTYDPWRRNAHAVSRGHKLKRHAIAATLLLSIAAAATAGWMLPRVAPNADATQLQFDAAAGRERTEKEVARANLLAEELARERSAKAVAERAASLAREQLAHEQAAKGTAERNAQQLERQVAEERRAKDVAERTAKDETEQIAKERAAREAEQRGASDMAKELARERDARLRAERNAQDALEQLGRERRAKEDAERAAKEAREQLAEVQKPKSNDAQAAMDPPAPQARQRRASGQIWDCRPRPPTGELICRRIARRGDR
jgi:uncharacterized glyoxalase superfamily protein PhnB